jgi:pimeloyl-ACP methyl ester carboxylesterase/membrane protein DedA with SNARE-associated domain
VRPKWWHVYLSLVALSLLWQWLSPRESQPRPGQSTIEVPRQTASGPTDGPPVRIAYRETGTGQPVIYLHGSPGSGGNSRYLAESLATRYRVLALDLPGFAASSRWIPDYGIEAHARYVLAFMDEMGIERAHLIGHSMGSGVALQLARLAPERIDSIVSYAGIGIQEGEGSGDYYFEHLKYAVGYGLLVVVPELLPHFGLLGPRDARHSFIRNFWDTDQRPLRPVLESLEIPFLILHGRDDPLVPAPVAEEHHRIVAHSELVMFDASHFLVFSKSGSQVLAREILPFLGKHDDPHAAPTRRTVDYSAGPRVLAPLPTALALERGVGPWTQIGMLVAATFVSEDLTCISAGLLARVHRIDPFVAVFGCFLGIFVTDMWLWLTGRWIGRRVLRWRWIARRVSPESLERFAVKFDRHLGKAVVASRFLPGTRLPMYVAAGIVSKRPVAFIVWLLLAASVWTPILVLAAMILGPVAAKPFQSVLGVRWLSWVGAAVLLLVALRIVTMLFSWRGRVRLIATVSKLWRWEFWPVWLFYLPVIPWIGWLAMRYGGLTTPTAANPALPHSGFVGESKFEILQHLPAKWVQPSFRIDPGDPASRIQPLIAHVQSGGWSFPLVVKPDEGQRGAGLKRVHNWEDVTRYVESEPRAVLVQTYHPGPCEAGIFYYRLPEQRSGRIFSITDKRFPEVVGDGRSTLEELISRHPRLRMQIAVFTRRHAARLSEVPAEAERVPLAVAGNHCQGTMFLDGSSLITPELERAVDTIAKHYDGFYFGRFDVRYANEDELRTGRGFRILELNGVTSESTNVYDPDWSLPAAYGTLCRQWALAFRIGATNRKRGHRTSSIRALLGAAYKHYGNRPTQTLSD